MVVFNLVFFFLAVWHKNILTSEYDQFLCIESRYKSPLTLPCEHKDRDVYLYLQLQKTVKERMALDLLIKQGKSIDKFKCYTDRYNFLNCVLATSMQTDDSCCSCCFKKARTFQASKELYIGKFSPYQYVEYILLPYAPTLACRITEQKMWLVIQWLQFCKKYNADKNVKQKIE